MCPHDLHRHIHIRCNQMAIVYTVHNDVHLNYIHITTLMHHVHGNNTFFFIFPSTVFICIKFALEC